MTHLQKSFTDQSNNLLAINTLKTSDVFDVMKLQEVVMDNLNPEEKNFIIPKTEKQFLARMTKLGQMLGVYKENGKDKQLIAYSTLAYPNDYWPVADMVYEKENLPCSVSKLAVIQNNVVHPLHRNKGLNTTLIAAQTEICAKKGKKHLMAEVAVSNPASLKGFLKMYFSVVNAGIDPDDGCKLLFLHRKAKYKPYMKFHRSNLSVDPVQDFDEVKGFVSSGWKGVDIERSSHKNGYELILKPML